MAEVESSKVTVYWSILVMVFHIRENQLSKNQKRSALLFHLESVDFADEQFLIQCRSSLDSVNVSDS